MAKVSDLIGSVGGFFGGGVWLYALAFGAGVFVTVTGGNLLSAGGRAADAKAAQQQIAKLAEDHSKASVAQAKVAIATVQNAGQREMNYIYNMNAEREQSAAVVVALTSAQTAGAKAQQDAKARGDQLTVQLKQKSAEYAALLETYKHADDDTSRLLGTNLTPELVCERYDSPGCKADHFAKAGYPAAPDRPPAVAKPAGAGAPPH